MRQISRYVLLFTMMFSIAGCSTISGWFDSDDDDPMAPMALSDITETVKIKELWSVDNNRIAVRFAYEWQDEFNQWVRSYGNENWQFNDKGLMEQRHASINDILIDENERKFLWAGDKRPLNYPGLTELGL